MKFSHWTLDDLIVYLQFLKHANNGMLDHRCITMCSGEITVYNGERKTSSKEIKESGVDFLVHSSY